MTKITANPGLPGPPFSVEDSASPLQEGAAPSTGRDLEGDARSFASRLADGPAPAGTPPEANKTGKSFLNTLNRPVPETRGQVADARNEAPPSRLPAPAAATAGPGREAASPANAPATPKDFQPPDHPGKGPWTAAGTNTGARTKTPPQPPKGDRPEPLHAGQTREPRPQPPTPAGSGAPSAPRTNRDHPAKTGTGRPEPSREAAITGEALLQSLRPGPPADSPPPADSAPPGPRLSEITREIVDRILVSDTARGGREEVRIILKDSTLAGTEVRISRESGKVTVDLVTTSEDSFRFLSQQQGDLKGHLETRLGDQVSVHVTHAGKEREDSQGRSRQRRDLYEEMEE